MKETPSPKLRGSDSSAIVQQRRDISKRDDVVEAVLAELNAICRNATFDFSNSIGKLIVDRLYAGNLDSWRSRGRKKSSLRRLARHPSLPMSPSALYRCIAIYEMCQRLNVGQWKHLSTTHLRAVLPLQSNEQARLLSTADAQLWSTARLSEEVASIRGRPLASRTRGGPKPRLHLLRTAKILETCLDSTGALIGADDADGRLSPSNAEAIAQLLSRLTHACSRLEARLSKRLPGAVTTPPPPASDGKHATDSWTNQGPACEEFPNAVVFGRSASIR